MTDSKKKTSNPTQLHTIMQGKGGVGKTFVASLICQNYQERNKSYTALDLDPVNRSLTAIKGLNAKPWDIAKANDVGTIDPVRFDELIEMLIESKDDVILDTGSTSFLPFSKYMVEQDVTTLLAANGVETNIHCVVRGGSSLLESINGLNGICQNYDAKSSKVFVWLNEVEGEIVMEGKQFEDMGVYINNVERIEAVLRIPQQTNELYQKDMTEMLKSNLTFAEAISSNTTRIMSKQRLQQLSEYFNSSMVASF